MTNRDLLDEYGFAGAPEPSPTVDRPSAKRLPTAIASQEDYYATVIEAYCQIGQGSNARRRGIYANTMSEAAAAAAAYRDRTALGEIVCVGCVVQRSTDGLYVRYAASLKPGQTCPDFWQLTG